MGRAGDVRTTNVDDGFATVADVLRAERHLLRDSLRRRDAPASDTDPTGTREESGEPFTEQREALLDRLNDVETRLRAVDQARAADDTYERLTGQGEHEAVAAVRTAAQGYDATPSARLGRAMSSQRPRDRGPLNLRRLIAQRFGRSGAER